MLYCGWKTKILTEMDGFPAEATPITARREKAEIFMIDGFYVWSLNCDNNFPVSGRWV